MPLISPIGPASYTELFGALVLGLIGIFFAIVALMVIWRVTMFAFTGNWK